MTIRIAAETPWYDLFSRGARDWLRHNQKVRLAVKESLPDLLAGSDLITRPNRTVAVPVKFLEHSRFRLLDAENGQGAGQGKGQPGDVLQPAREEGGEPGEGGGNGNGEIRFVVELKVDEIVDWLWEELKLPELKPKRSATMDEPDYVREGWDKRGARSRLDRRKTMKEAVKRRSIQVDPVSITNDDLRFRQLVKRATPATNAAVIFALDVSGSMDEGQRRLAKQFFFFALQGIRRQYSKVETLFLAHAAEAWEFDESQFFQASSSGGTVTSGVAQLALEKMQTRFDPSRYNTYFFYASDGENAAEDREPARAALAEIAKVVNYAGYVETGGVATFRPRETQLAELFGELKARGCPVGVSHLGSQEDIWRAIREFFTEQSLEKAGMTTELEEYAARIEGLAHRLGLDYYPVDFEVAPQSLMTEIAVYGLPVRMPHWSFGVRYIHQLVRQSMGHSKIFEVMFPGDPCRAFLMDGNSLAENTLVTAHVLGHADFSKNNQLFARFHDMSGGNIVEKAAAHAHRIHQAIEAVGLEKVETVLDAALALESHVDVTGELHRARYDEFVKEKKRVVEGDFRKRFRALPGESEPQMPPIGALKASVPPHPEIDLLWFIAQYAPDLEQWERDIFLAVRAESLYFYPVFACQIMNEGWASYWHARLLRDADFLPSPLYLDAIKAHSDVVRPFASGEQTALAINPYHLGFTLWEHIVARHGLDKARAVMKEEDDFGFIRNWLDAELAEKLDLFVYETRPGDEIRVANRDVAAVREAILAPKFNFGAPRVAAVEVKSDGGLVLAHEHASDGRGLDATRARKVLEYTRRGARRRPVRLHTVNERAEPVELAA